MPRRASKKKSGKRIFGSAAGKIRFRKGWDASMTDQEVDKFISDQDERASPPTSRGDANLGSSRRPAD